MGIKIRAQHDISSEYLAAISDQLYEYNQRITGKRDVRGLSFVALDGDDVVGAATGYSWGGIAELEVLWVDEGHRGAGLGTRLLAEFVGEAALRDTRRVWVSSHDFQAPELYERSGFKRVAELEGWPEGHTNVILCKQIGA